MDGGISNHRFHHVSTDEVYGSLEAHGPPFHENTPYDPSSPYSASKAASDHIVRAYQGTYGLKVTISNCSNNYGPYYFPEKLIPLTTLNVLNGKPIPVFGNGKNIRDWLFVEDHCRGIDTILNNGQVGHTNNIGGMCEKTNIEVVKYLCSIIDEVFLKSPEMLTPNPKTPASNKNRSSSLITYVDDRKAQDWRYAIDTSKISSELGFTPTETFDSGLRKTVLWYLDNENWWRSLENQSYDDWLVMQYGSSH